MLAEHSDDVLERMRVLRESQVLLVSGTRGAVAGGSRVVAESSLQVFIGESSLRALSIIGHGPEGIGDKAPTWSIVSSGGKITRDLSRPPGAARARDSLIAPAESLGKRTRSYGRYENVKRAACDK